MVPSVVIKPVFCGSALIAKNAWNIRTHPSAKLGLQAIARKLSAIIRLADGMDVSHGNRVTRAALTEKKKRWELTLYGKGDLMLEKWALDKRRELFEEIFGVPLEIMDKNQ